MRAYENTVLDTLDPWEIVGNTQEQLAKHIDSYSTGQIKALRHYIATQAINDQYGAGPAKFLTDLWETWKSTDDEHSRIDKINNAKALLDYRMGKTLPVDKSGFFSKPVLDSLLNYLTIPNVDAYPEEAIISRPPVSPEEQYPPPNPQNTLYDI